MNKICSLNKNKYCKFFYTQLLILFFVFNVLFGLVNNISLSINYLSNCCHSIATNHDNQECNLMINYQVDVFNKFTQSDNLLKFDLPDKLLIQEITIYNMLGNITLNRKINKETRLQELKNIANIPIIKSYIGINSNLPIFYSIISQAIISLFLSVILSPISLLLYAIFSSKKEIFILPINNLNNKLLSLNFFRFIAASIVVFFHFADDSIRYSVPSIFLAGSQMVTFFFVLSGFVMIVAHYQKNNESFLGYYKLRFARLYPVYILALLLLVRANSTTIDIVLGVLLLQAFVPGHELAINQTGWSLSAESFFYLCFPCLLFFYKKRSLFINISILIIVLSLSLIIKNSLMDSKFSADRDSIMGYFPLIHLASFIIGNLIGLLYLQVKLLYKNSFILDSVLVIVSFILMIYDLESGGVLKNVSIIPPVLYGAPFFALFILAMAVSKQSIFHYILQNRVCLRLGDMSYSIYILQFFVYNKLANILILFDSSWSKFFIPYTLLIVLSYFTYKYIEIPCKRFILRVL